MLEIKFNPFKLIEVFADIVFTQDQGLACDTFVAEGVSSMYMLFTQSHTAGLQVDNMVSQWRCKK